MQNKQMNAVVVRPFCFLSHLMLGKQEKVLRICNLDTTRAVRDIATSFYLIMRYYTEKLLAGFLM